MKTSLAVLLPLACLAACIPAGPPKQSLDSGGVRIQYAIDGQGPPVVLIHGLHSNADVNWRLPGTTKALAEEFQVISIDVRGHGGSDKPKQKEAYGLEMVEDVVRLLDRLHIKQAHIVGYSLGGMIAMKLLAEHPERVKSLTLGGMGWMRDGSLLQRIWAKLPEREGSSTPSACARSLGDLALSEADIKAIQAPVAVLIGARDPCKGLYVVPLQRVRPDWPVTEIEDAGHLNCIFKQAFKDALKKRLEELTR